MKDSIKKREAREKAGDGEKPGIKIEFSKPLVLGHSVLFEYV
jgi:hypothetical protein